MNVVIVGVRSLASSKARLAATMIGKAQKASPRIDFASAELLWRVLAPNRLAILRAMCGTGPLSLREIARRVSRDVKGVPTDVRAILLAGVLDRVSEGLFSRSTRFTLISRCGRLRKPQCPGWRRAGALIVFGIVAKC